MCALAPRSRPVAAEQLLADERIFAAVHAKQTVRGFASPMAAAGACYEQLQSSACCAPSPAISIRPVFRMRPLGQTTFTIPPQMRLQRWLRNDIRVDVSADGGRFRIANDRETFVDVDVDRVRVRRTFGSLRVDADGQRYLLTPLGR